MEKPIEKFPPLASMFPDSHGLVFRKKLLRFIRKYKFWNVIRHVSFFTNNVLQMCLEYCRVSCSLVRLRKRSRKLNQEKKERDFFRCCKNEKNLVTQTHTCTVPLSLSLTLSLSLFLSLSHTKHKTHIHTHSLTHLHTHTISLSLYIYIYIKGKIARYSFSPDNQESSLAVTSLE